MRREENKNNLFSSFGYSRVLVIFCERLTIEHKKFTFFSPLKYSSKNLVLVLVNVRCIHIFGKIWILAFNLTSLRDERDFYILFKITLKLGEKSML